MLKMISGIYRFVVAPAIFISLFSCDPKPTIPDVGSPNVPIYDWTALATDLTINYTDIFFIDQNTGWIVGENLLLTTVDAGVNWALTPGESFSDDLRKVHFIDKDRGWVVGGALDEATESVILVTELGGAYFESQKNIDNILNSIFFINGEIGWAAGSNGVLLQTVNGGSDWDNIDSGITENINDILFSSENKGLYVADLGNIYVTENGADWNKENVDLTSDILSINYLSDDLIWFSGSNNTILKRKVDENQQVSWHEYAVSGESMTTIWKDVSFLDEQTGWVIGNFNRVYRTKDGGQTWIKETTGQSVDFSAVYMFDEGSGLIVGDDGVVLRYTPLEE